MGYLQDRIKELEQIITEKDNTIQAVPKLKFP